MLERTDAITNGVLEPFTFILAYPIVYHKSVSLYNLYSYVFRHFHVVMRKFHDCDLPSS